MTDTSTKTVNLTASDLVRLAKEWDENAAPQPPFFATGHLLDAMADHIEELAAERDKWHAGWMEAEAKVSELEAERDALKAELHEARMQAIVDFGKLQKACEERDALKATNKKLRGALTPFSEEASWWFEKNYDASEPVVEGFADYNGVMTCGDLFRARAALQENTDA